MGKADDVAKGLSSIFDPKTLAEATRFRSELEKIDGNIAKVTNATKVLLRPISILDEGIASGSDSFAVFNKSAEATTISLAKIAETIGGKELAGKILAVGNTVVAMNEEIYNLGTTLDAQTGNIRKYREDMFELASSFGGNYEKSQELATGLAELSGQVSERSVVGFSDLKDALDSSTTALGNTSIHYNELFKTINAGADSFNAMEASILLARKSGDSMQQTMRFLTQAVQKQGVSIEDAIVQYSGFFEVAEKTGLRFQEVRNSLENVASAYSKIGVNADFAKPIIETFSRSLSDAGLGISNATGLSESLSRSLIDVSSSYEKAYLMVQKGGLDVGTTSGGVLGASIGLRARIMDAEDAGDQAGIGLEMADAMKKTLESMSGGRLVDIREARDDPALMQTYFKQESLMGSMYGMDKNTASRTIEMLKKLDDTTIMGNDALKAELGENLNDQLKNQDKNLGYQDRIAKSTENMFASSVLTNEILMKMVDRTNASAAAIAKSQASTVGATYETGFELAEGLAGTAAEITEKAEDKLVGLSNQMQKFNELQKNLAGAKSFTSADGGKKTPGSILTGGFDPETQLTKDGAVLGTKIDGLNTQIGNLTQAIKDNDLTFSTE